MATVSTGTKGEHSYENDFHFVCCISGVDNRLWKRKWHWKMQPPPHLRLQSFRQRASFPVLDAVSHTGLGIKSIIQKFGHELRPCPRSVSRYEYFQGCCEASQPQVSARFPPQKDLSCSDAAQASFFSSFML